jgi:hypothetical protein
MESNAFRRVSTLPCGDAVWEAIVPERPEPNEPAEAATSEKWRSHLILQASNNNAPQNIKWSGSAKQYASRKKNRSSALSWFK